MELYPRLEVIRGKEPGRVFPLAFAATILGRSSKVGIHLQDTGISRHHARFLVQSGVVKLEDLKSTNGSFRNGQKVTASKLQDGDQLQFGSCRLVFRTNRPSLNEGKSPSYSRGAEAKGTKSPSPSPQSCLPKNRRSIMKPNANPKLHHEDLDSYQVSINFLALAFKIIENLPRGSSELAKQFRRAALSIPLNIAEGYGRRTKDDRSNFYSISRGSAHECGAVLDSAKVLELIDEEAFVNGKRLLRRIVSMLVKMSE